MEYDLNQPWLTLDDWQKEYINTPPEQDCFLLTGRQVGKTAAMAIKAVELCVHHFGKGQNILINSITEKQAYRMLARAEVYARIKYPKILITTGRKKPTMHQINFTTGAGIFCYAAGESGEGLRGDTIKKLMTDEGSRMSEEYYIATIPMLSVSKGSHDVSSTPCGTHDNDGRELWFYKASKDPHYKKFYVSAEDCPRHNKEFLQRQRESMPQLKYAQEFLSQFINEFVRLFSDALIDKCMVIQRSFSSEHPADPNCPTALDGVPVSHFIGADIARFGEDQNVFIDVARFGREKIRMVEMQISTHQSVVQTADAIKSMREKHKARKVYIDAAGVGGGVYDILLATSGWSNRIESLENAKRSLDRDDEKRIPLMKEAMYMNLITLMEQGKIELIKDPELAASLRSVQYEYDEKGRLRPFGSYTHAAEALVRAAWCIKDKTLALWAA